MNKLLSAASALAIVVGGSVVQASVVLTTENLDAITAGLTIDAFSTVSTNLNSSTITSIVIDGTTILGQCSGNNCTITINRSLGSSGITEVCSSCTLTISQSGITVTDTSGRIWFDGTAWLRANPQNSHVIKIR
jgi:hypothetical protein